MLRTMLFFVLAQIWVNCDANAALKIAGNAITQAAGVEYNTLTSTGGNATRVEIFQKMIAANQTFEFDDVVHAGQHFDVRSEAVKAIKEVQAGTIKFSGGSSPPVGWGRIAGNSQYFKANTNQTPAEAIRKIETGTTKGECAGCVDACIMIAWRRALGDVEINRQLDTKKSLLKIDNTYLSTDPVTGADKHTNLIPGDALHMDNHDYAPSDGPWQGENVLYIGGDRFSGLAAFDMTEAQLRATLKQKYVDDRGPFTGNAEMLIKWDGHSRIKILSKK